MTETPDSREPQCDDNDVKRDEGGPSEESGDPAPSQDSGGTGLAEGEGGALRLPDVASEAPGDPGEEAVDPAFESGESEEQEVSEQLDCNDSEVYVTPPESEVVSVSISATSTLICVGTADGTFYIFNERHELLHKQEKCGGPVMLVEALLQSSLVATVNASLLSYELDIDESPSRLAPTKNTETAAAATSPTDSKEDTNAVDAAASSASTCGGGEVFSSPRTSTDPPSGERGDQGKDSGARKGASRVDTSGLASSAPVERPSKEERCGCRDVQLWNIQTSSRVALIRFPAAVPPGPRAASVPRVFFDGLSDRHSRNTGPDFTEEKLAEPIVALRMSHRRLVVFFDCPSAEVEIFDLRSLRLVHRLERNVALGQCRNLRQFGIPVGDLLRLGFYHKKAYFGVSPSRSLAGISALSLHPCLGYLAIPLAVPAVDVAKLDRSSSYFPVLGRTSAESSCPVADESAVAGLSSSGAYARASGLGHVGLVDILGEIKVLASVKAHEHPIAAMAMNGAATMLVTSSVQGTLFRVWSLPLLEQLLCLRRGSRWAQVFHISFTGDSQYIVSTSRVRQQASVAFVPGTSKQTAMKSLLSSVARSQTECTCQKNSYAVHVFSCARQFSQQQRSRHAAPQALQVGSPSFAENSGAQRGAPFMNGDRNNSRPRPHERHGDEQQGLEDRINMHQEKLGSLCERPPGASSSWRARCQELKSSFTMVRDLAGNQLKQLLHGVVAPKLPSSFCEAVVDAQKHLVVAHIRQPSIRLGLEAPRVCVATARGGLPGGRLEIRIFSQMGFVATFAGDEERGGEARIIDEKALLSQSA